MGTDIGIVLYFAMGIEIGPLASLVRMFRIGRIFRLINSAKSLNKYFTTILTSLPSLYNIGLVLFLFMFIFSIMGVQLFSKVAFNDDLTPRANFRNVGMAFVLLFRFSTGENWNGAMHSMLVEVPYKECHPDPPNPRNSEWCWSSNKPACDGDHPDPSLPIEELELFGDESCCVELYGCGDVIFGYVYFYSYTMLITYVLLKLFLGVILDAFDESETGDSLTPGEVDLFCEDWCTFDEEGTGRMRADKLPDFIKILDKPMGFGEDLTISKEQLLERLEQIGVMSIIVDRGLDAEFGEPYVEILDVVTALAKRVVKERVGDFDDIDEPEDEMNTPKKKGDTVRFVLQPEKEKAARKARARTASSFSPTHRGPSPSLGGSDGGNPAAFTRIGSKVAFTIEA